MTTRTSQHEIFFKEKPVKVVSSSPKDRVEKLLELYRTEQAINGKRETLPSLRKFLLRWPEIKSVVTNQKS